MDHAQETTLRLWILCLSFGSGYSNVTAIERFNQPVSHVTGTASQLARALFEREAFLVGRLLSVLACFLLGSVLAGVLFHHRVFMPKKRYGALMVLGGMIIFLFKNTELLFYFLCFFMGLQNAMFLGYRGHLIRSTHLTGYLSDIGFEIGCLLAGKTKYRWKIGFYLLSIVFFILGGLFSVYFHRLGMQIEFLSGIYLLLGSSYFYLRRRELFSLQKKSQDFGRSTHEK